VFENQVNKEEDTGKVGKERKYGDMCRQGWGAWQGSRNGTKALVSWVVQDWEIRHPSWGEKMVSR
jgi:hypothetical protein